MDAPNSTLEEQGQTEPIVAMPIYYQNPFEKSNNSNLIEMLESNSKKKITSKFKKVRLPLDYNKKDYLNHINILRKQYEDENPTITKL